MELIITESMILKTIIFILIVFNGVMFSLKRQMIKDGIDPKDKFKRKVWFDCANMSTNQIIDFGNHTIEKLNKTKDRDTRKCLIAVLEVMNTVVKRRTHGKCSFKE